MTEPWESKKILRDEDNVPIPQIWDSEAEEFVPYTGDVKLTGSILAEHDTDGPVAIKAVKDEGSGKYYLAVVNGAPHGFDPISGKIKVLTTVKSSFVSSPASDVSGTLGLVVPTATTIELATYPITGVNFSIVVAHWDASTFQFFYSTTRTAGSWSESRQLLKELPIPHKVKNNGYFLSETLPLHGEEIKLFARHTHGTDRQINSFGILQTS